MSCCSKDSRASSIVQALSGMFSVVKKSCDHHAKTVGNIPMMLQFSSPVPGVFSDGSVKIS